MLRGATGYLILWLMGVPVGLLILFWILGIGHG